MEYPLARRDGSGLQELIQLGADWTTVIHGDVGNPHSVEAIRRSALVGRLNTPLSKIHVIVIPVWVPNKVSVSPVFSLARGSEKRDILCIRLTT
jgi:uncharacterized membrane protein